MKWYLLIDTINLNHILVCLNRVDIFDLAHFSPLFCSWPLACLSWDSARNCWILSEGMAKDIPAVTFSVLIPITSPSYSNRHKSEDTHTNTPHICMHRCLPVTMWCFRHWSLWMHACVCVHGWLNTVFLPTTYVSRLRKTWHKHYRLCKLGPGCFLSLLLIHYHIRLKLV